MTTTKEKPKRKKRGIPFSCLRCGETHTPTDYPEGSYLEFGAKTKAVWEKAAGWEFHKKYAVGTEAGEALVRLRQWIKPGATLYTVLRHRSRSGMMRHISVLGIEPRTEEDFKRSGEKHTILDYSWNVARVLDWTMDRGSGGVKVGGGGMDLGFHLVYSLARVLFERFICVGEGCPSNDHTNGAPRRKGQRHSDGGYALKHRWL